MKVMNSTLNIRYFILAVSLVFTTFSHAQPSLLNFKNRSDDSRYRLVLNPGNENMATLRFAPSQFINRTELTDWLRDKLELRSGLDELGMYGQLVQVKNGLKIERLQQYYRSIKVIYGQISFLSRNEKVSSKI